MTDEAADSTEDRDSEKPDHIAVVGTDTGVGKTVVSAGLTGWLRERNIDARAVKPAQTGFPSDDDAEFVARACEIDDAATCLARLEPPLAPAVAADREGVDLSYEEIVGGCRRELAASAVGLVEGIGGLRVPLAGDREVVDLVSDLGVSAIVVARSGLGTLNHTALTVEGLRNRDVPVHGIVLNSYEGTSVAERTNPEVLEGMVDLPVWTLPPIRVDPPTAVVDACQRALPEAVIAPFDPG